MWEIKRSLEVLVIMFILQHQQISVNLNTTRRQKLLSHPSKWQHFKGHAEDLCTLDCNPSETRLSPRAYIWAPCSNTKSYFTSTGKLIEHNQNK